MPRRKLEKYTLEKYTSDLEDPLIQAPDSGHFGAEAWRVRIILCLGLQLPLFSALQLPRLFFSPYWKAWRKRRSLAPTYWPSKFTSGNGPGPNRSVRPLQPLTRISEVS